MLHTPLYPWGRPTRPQKPNRFQRYNKPLPIHVRSSPTLDSQIPFSFDRIYTVISSLIFPSSSHPSPLYQAYYDPATKSVQVMDETAVQAFWEQGFFGKGSLSRSEPEWIERVKRRLGVLRLAAGQTSADITKKRRNERKDFKMERARLEAEAIKEQLKTEKENRPSDIQLKNGVDPKQEKVTIKNTANKQNGSYLDATSRSSNLGIEATPEIRETNEFGDISNKEHLQLSAIEAFFLTYSLGVLNITNLATGQLLSLQDSFSLFRRVSYSPPRAEECLQPDDPFILSYVVYHHFRSLGWVVRPGMKFAADFLLYHRGPVFAHAEFAVLIMPSYEHSYWKIEKGRGKEIAQKDEKEWWWLLGANRVQTQVRKSLILVYVDIPPPIQNVHDEDLDVTAFLQQYRVREFIVKRWSANRNRD